MAYKMIYFLPVRMPHAEGVTQPLGPDHVVSPVGAQTNTIKLAFVPTVQTARSWPYVAGGHPQ